jgi:hypothetical protein
MKMIRAVTLLEAADGITEGLEKAGFVPLIKLDVDDAYTISTGFPNCKGV